MFQTWHHPTRHLPPPLGPAQGWPGHAIPTPSASAARPKICSTKGAPGTTGLPPMVYIPLYWDIFNIIYRSMYNYIHTCVCVWIKSIHMILVLEDWYINGLSLFFHHCNWQQAPYVEATPSLVWNSSHLTVRHLQRDRNPRKSAKTDIENIEFILMLAIVLAKPK